MSVFESCSIRPQDKQPRNRPSHVSGDKAYSSRRTRRCRRLPVLHVEGSDPGSVGRAITTLAVPDRLPDLPWGQPGPLAFNNPSTG
ncbi:hypothetical protein GCM10010304_76320 [Streptomyces roseoviolaceus]